jgi:hypothetical protein
MNTPKVIAGWHVLDGTGELWSVACVECNGKKLLPKALLQGAAQPKCRCTRSAFKEQARLRVYVPADNADKPAKREQPKPAPLPAQIAIAARRTKSVAKRPCLQRPELPRDRKPDPANRRNIARKFFPGEVYGSIVIVAESERTNHNRVLLVRCTVCDQLWKVAAQNAARTPDKCVCAHRWRQTEAHAQKLAEIRQKDTQAKRKARLAAQRLANCDGVIAKLEVQLRQWRDKKAELSRQYLEEHA